MRICSSRGKSDSNRLHGVVAGGSTASFENKVCSGADVCRPSPGRSGTSACDQLSLRGSNGLRRAGISRYGSASARSCRSMREEDRLPPSIFANRLVRDLERGTSVEDVERDGGEVTDEARDLGPSAAVCA
jgi:hypothetical protein